MYAENTSVPVERSRAMIEHELRRYGADQFVSGWDGDRGAVIQFRARDRHVKVVLHLPRKDRPEFVCLPNKLKEHQARVKQAEARGQTAPLPFENWCRKPPQILAAWEQEVRRLWRALHLTVKARLESVASGIESFERAFLDWIVLPDGRTIGDVIAPQIEEAYQTGRMPPMLQLTAGSETR